MIIYGFRQKKKKRKYWPKVKTRTKDFHDFMATNHSAGRLKEAFFRAFNLKEKQTPSEKITEEALKYLGVNYIPQYVIFYKRGQYRIVDFYLPDHRIVLEIDGKCHSTSSEYDQFKDRNTKYKTIRITNEQTDQVAFKDHLNIIIGGTILNPHTSSQTNICGPLINSSKGYSLKEMKEAGLL